MEVLNSKALIDLYINYHEFVSENNVLREYDEMNKKLNALRMLWNILYKNNGNILCRL